MRNFKNKLLVSAIILMLLMLITGVAVYATNDNLKIVKVAADEYRVYIEYNETAMSKNFINYPFKFAFSNSSSETGLTYLDAGEDTVNGIYGAYIPSDLYDEFFDGKPTTYMWAKKTSTGEPILSGIVIDLSAAIDITNSVLEDIDDITKTINVEIDKDKPISYTDSNGVKQTVQREKITVLTAGEFYYQIEKIPSNNANYNRLYELATKISTYNIYNKLDHLSELNEFISLFNLLYGGLDNNIGTSSTSWILAENGEIPQPEDARDGEQYIIWIRNRAGTLRDIQFMTAWEEPDQGYVPSLLVTGDDNVLLIVFGGLITAIIVVSIILKVTKTKKVTTSHGKRYA